MTNSNFSYINYSDPRYGIEWAEKFIKKALKEMEERLLKIQQDDERFLRACGIAPYDTTKSYR